MDRPNVLVVDDETRVTSTLDRLLQQEFDTFTANSGSDALDVVRHNRINVVVSDQRMPNMTGVDLLSKVKMLSPNTTRVLLTGYSDLDAIVGSINQGEIFRFIQKPWSNQDLIETVNRGSEISRKLYSSDRVPLVKAEGDDAFAGTRVLVVDASRETFVLTERVFGKTTHLEFAETLDQARDLLNKHHFSVVMLSFSDHHDLEIDFLRMLRLQHPTSVSVVVSARNDSNQLIRLINDGQVYRYLMSPVKIGALKINLLSSLRHSLHLQSAPGLTAQLHSVAIDGAVTGSAVHTASNAPTPEPGILKRLSRLPGLSWFFPHSS